MSIRKAISNYEIKNSNCIDFLQLLKGKDTNVNKSSKWMFILFFVLSLLKTVPALRSTFCAVPGVGTQHHSSVTGCQS